MITGSLDVKYAIDYNPETEQYTCTVNVTGDTGRPEGKPIQRSFVSKYKDSALAYAVAHAMDAVNIKE